MHSNIEKNLKILEGNLIESGLNKKKNNKMIELISESISSRVPEPIGKGIGLYMMAALSNGLMQRIKFGHDNIIPANAIVFLVAPSSIGKTSTVEALKRGFRPFLSRIYKSREEGYRKIRSDGSGNIKISDFFKGRGTKPGLLWELGHSKDLLSGPNPIMIDEIATVFEEDDSIKDFIDVIAQLFDSGKIEQDSIKTAELRVNPIKESGVTALLMGTGATMGKDNKSHDTFMALFQSKLARRCVFIKVDSKDTVELDRETSFKDRYLDENKAKDIAEKKLLSKNQEVMNFWESSLDNLDIGRAMEIDDDAMVAYRLLEDYYKHLGEKYYPEESLNNSSATMKIALSNASWKILKIAGVFSFFNMHKTLTFDDFLEAKTLVESFDGQLNLFLEKSMELPFRYVEKYIRKNMKPPTLTKLLEDGIISDVNEIKTILLPLNENISDIGELKLIDNSFNFIPREEEVIKDKWICSVSYSKELSVKIDDMMVIAKSILDKDRNITDNLLSISRLDSFIKSKLDAKKLLEEEKNEELYKKIISRIKSYRSMKSSSTMKPFNISLEQITKALSVNSVICPVHFNENKRSAKNAIEKVSMLILDVDESEDIMEQVHNEISDYNHIIVSSSDRENKRKFKIILPLSKDLEITRKEYSQLVQEAGDALSLEVDPASGMTQPMLFYKDSISMMVTNAEYYEVSNLDKIREEDAKYRKRFAGNNNLLDQKKMMRNVPDLFKPWIKLDDDYTVLGKRIHKFQRMLRARRLAIRKGYSNDNIEYILRALNDKIGLDPLKLDYIINSIEVIKDGILGKENLE